MFLIFVYVPTTHLVKYIHKYHALVIVKYNIYKIYIHVMSFYFINDENVISQFLYLHNIFCRYLICKLT